MTRNFFRTVLPLLAAMAALGIPSQVQGQLTVDSPPAFQPRPAPAILPKPAVAPATSRPGGAPPSAIVAAPPAPAPNPAERWALAIGVGKFKGRTSPNPGSAGDALDVTELLVKNGWPADHIRTLTDSAATGEAIRSGLQWLSDRCGFGSSCVFHYSGHTKQLRANDGDAEVLDEALWGHDNRFVPDGEVAGYLRKLPSAWINFSGCEGAGFDDSISSPNRLVTASSQESEKSYEHPDWKNSIFTGLFVDQGILQGEADANHDATVTRDEAFSFAALHAPKITLRQARGPQNPYMAGGQAGTWLLPEPSNEPPPVKATPSRLMGPCVFGLPCHTSVIRL
ncbi:MAG: caspase family protein [Actinomycetota bacterium]